MYCPKCGLKINETSCFCPNCGETLRPNTSPKGVKKNSFLAIILNLASIGASLVLVLFYFALEQGNLLVTMDFYPFEGFLSTITALFPFIATVCAVIGIIAKYQLSKSPEKPVWLYIYFSLVIISVVFSLIGSLRLVLLLLFVVGFIYYAPATLQLICAIHLLKTLRTEKK